MNDFLQRGLDWLNTTLKANCPLSATYTRGSDSIPLTIRIGRTVFVSNRQGGTRIEFGEIDFLITATDLVVAGIATTPAEGDRITATIRGNGYTFELMAPGGEPAWRYSDAYRTAFRVHCKQVG